MEFHSGGLFGGEAPRIDGGQGPFDGKRGTILNDDVAEPDQRAARYGFQDAKRQRGQEALQHPTHKFGEAFVREAIVEGFVRNLRVVLIVELPEEVGQRFDSPAGQRGQD